VNVASELVAKVALPPSDLDPSAIGPVAVPVHARNLPPSRQVDVPGIGEVFVREAPGPAGAPVLVLLHGWTSTADISWFNVMHRLGEHYRVIAPDLRGHRGGPRSRQRATLNRCADDVAALASVLELGQITVVGYSMGGAVAQLVARRHPDLVSGLVLCAAAEQYRKTVYDTLRFSGVLAGAMAARLLHPNTSSRLAQRTMERMFGRSPFQEWVDSQTAAHSWREVLEMGVSLGAFNSRKWVGTLTQPVHVVVTTQDGDVPPDRQWRLAEDTVAKTHMVCAGHSACLNRPDLFLPPLLDACAALTSASTAGAGAVSLAV
jgi:3-oxoadipate enol-lactonase